MDRRKRAAGVFANGADNDGDGWPGAWDCDDDNADVNPDATEVCDGAASDRADNDAAADTDARMEG